MPKPTTQPGIVLNDLIQAGGNWVSGRVFLRERYISQFHRAIHDLENKFGWKGRIEHSGAPDEYGFIQYRITGQTVLI